MLDKYYVKTLFSYIYRSTHCHFNKLIDYNFKKFK